MTQLSKRLGFGPGDWPLVGWLCFVVFAAWAVVFTPSQAAAFVGFAIAAGCLLVGFGIGAYLSLSAQDEDGGDGLVNSPRHSKLVVAVTLVIGVGALALKLVRIHGG